MTHPIERITQSDPNYPVQLKGYLKTEAPETIWARGKYRPIDGSGGSPKRRPLGTVLF